MPDVSFQPGEYIFKVGDPGDCAYQVRSGRVELLAGTDDAQSPVAEFKPGDVFGEMSLIEERPRAFSARAAEAVTATALTRDEFESLLTSDPAQCRYYLRSLFERLRQLSARVSATAPTTLTVPAQQAAPPVEFPSPAATPRTDVPRVVLYPLTRRAAQTLPDDGLIISRFPFRIGRVTGPNEPDSLDLNDIWLIDSKPYNVSRNHCSIDLDDDGTPIVTDRGSHLGVWVNDQHIGGRSATRTMRLHSGHNVLIIGTSMSPYQFRISIGD